MGVGKKSTNTAVISELGRYIPNVLLYDTLQSILLA
jgi:hypothetical protein